MGSLAASGGYYIACGSSRIVANKGTLTGSIGVIAEFLQLREALDKIGVDVKVIKSGKMKDAGSPVREMTGEDQAYFQSLMDEVHRQFTEVVILERKLDREKVLGLADGRVFTGEDALAKGLIDTLGTFQDAVAISAAMAGIEGDPALVRERKRHYWWQDFGADVLGEVTALKNEILDRPVLSYRFVGP
jgi:protease-4